MTRKKNNGAYYTEDELYLMLRSSYEYKKTIMIPNDIFSDFLSCKEFKGRHLNINRIKNNNDNFVKKANVTHIAFAFSYVFLISYLYRYANYTQYFNGENIFIDEQTIFMICGTSPTSKGENGVSYITKKGGLLEKLNYIKKTKDIPTDYFYYDSYGFLMDSLTEKPDEIRFSYFYEYEYPDGLKIPKNKSISYPQKAFYIDKESEDEGINDGYFFYPENTTKVNINVFIFCMARKNLGTIGFYLFCFLKCQCDYYRAVTGSSGYTKSFEDLILITGIGRTKLSEMLLSLEKHNMISNSHNAFVPNLPKDKKIPANTYTVKDFSCFNGLGTGNVNSRNIMDFEKYDKQVGIYINDSNDIGDKNIEDGLSNLQPK